MVDFDKKMIQRCLHLAKRGIGNTSPNPMVGSVIVHKEKIIGEGFHRQYGEAHAEVNAINSVKDKSLLSESTLYVNLEPCSHWGKTPPCADLIIQHQLKRVVIGSIDTCSLVAGNGVRKIKEAGIQVSINVEVERCRELNKRFFTYHEKKRPYIILKWAETSDGFVDKLRTPEENLPQWITNDEARLLVHRWRSEEDAILVGKNTALLDNPSLNVRYTSGKKPTRIVIDFNGDLPLSLNLFDGSQSTIVFSTKPDRYNIERLQTFKIEQDFSIKNILDTLYNLKIQSIIIEGGTFTLQQFINEGYWDEALRFVGNKTFINGIQAPKFPFAHNEVEQIGDCVLFTYYRS